MRINIPSRKVKSTLRALSLMIALFLATIVACAVCFVFFTFSTIRIISPLMRLSGVVNSDNAIATVKNMCKDTHLSCVTVVALPDGSLQITLDSGAVAILSTQKDLKKQLASLQQVASQLTIKGKQLKRVDFRFAQVVVSF